MSDDRHKRQWENNKRILPLNTYKMQCNINLVERFLVVQGYLTQTILLPLNHHGHVQRRKVAALYRRKRRRKREESDLVTRMKLSIQILTHSLSCK